VRLQRSAVLNIRRARKITRMSTVRQSVGALVSLAIIVGIAATVGYGIGVRVGAGPRMSETKVFRDIPAYAGDNQVSATVDGVTYGVSGAVPWLDALGSWHEAGWPACVPPRSQLRITFGGALVLGPTGTGGYQMLWVDCRR
jgi:hypothetical protein